MKHGGRRPGAGRPARGGQAGRNVVVRLSEAEEAAMHAVIGDEEDVSAFIRLAIAREVSRRRG